MMKRDQNKRQKQHKRHAQKRYLTWAAVGLGLLLIPRRSSRQATPNPDSSPNP